MKNRHLLSAIALGLGLTVVLLWSLTHPTPPVHANPGIYYVREGGTSTTCITFTDPCASVQQAINLATSPGDEVWVATGTYTENLTITHSVKLRGGWDITFTVQTPITYPTILDGSDDHNMRVRDAPLAEVTIEGLTLRNGQDGIHIWTGDVTVGRCTILNVNKQGFEIDGGTVLISATQILTAQQGIEVDDGVVQVVNVHIAHTSEEGLLIEGGGTVTFAGSTVEDCQQQGIQVDRGSLWLFDNLIRNINADGIRIEDGAVSIVSNTVHTIASDGVDVSGTQTISGNLVYDTVRRGIYAHDGTLTVLSNNVNDTGDDGISTARGAVVTIRDNTVTNAGNDGIDAHGSAVIVAGNRVYDTRDRGINAENGALTITNNTVHNTDGDGVRTAGSSTQVEIRGNTVYSTGNDGIDARGDVIAISHNAVSGCADNGIRSEGDESARIEANRVLSNGVGLAVRGAPVFTITNNVIGDHITASAELTGTGTGFLYHNTLVGSSTGAQGAGLAVLDPLTLILANNIVVSHNVGISATAGATLIASHTLLWGNNDDPVSSTTVILAPPLFVDPARQDYHLLPDSPAVDAGTDVGVNSDVDGDPRPTGPLPDVGADEFPAALSVTKQASPDPVRSGAQLTYTIYVTNTGNVTLTATITDALPNHVTPTGTCTWTPTIAAPGGVWIQTVVVTVESDYAGPLANVVQVTTDEGATGVYTNTLAPDLAVTKQAHTGGSTPPLYPPHRGGGHPVLVQPGEQLTYTIYVTNTGNFHLHTTITDTLPAHVTPTGTCTWTPTITAPGGIWTQTVVVTVEADYAGPLTNVVQVTTDEGATGVYTHTLAPDLHVIKQAHTGGSTPPLYPPHRGGGHPVLVQAGEQLTYTIYVTNTGNFHLHTTITDTLPAHVTPTGTCTWTPTITAPGGVWIQTVVVTVETDYAGPLTNVVQVTTDEGATGVYTETATAFEPHFIYLPLVLRNYQSLSGLQNPGFEPNNR